MIVMIWITLHYVYWCCVCRPVTMGTGREQYQRQLEQLRTANVELESSCDDYRVKVDELNSELMELRKKVTIHVKTYSIIFCGRL